MNPGRATLTLVFTIVCAGLIVGSVYRYAYGDWSRERFYRSVAFPFFGLAFFLLQLTYLFSSAIADVVEAISIVLFLAGIGTMILWWRTN